MPLWDSSLSPLSESPGVIDWFTIVIGLIAVVTLAIHGANWIILKTNSSINSDLKALVFKLNSALLLLTIFSLVIWQIVNPNSLNKFYSETLSTPISLIYISGLVGYSLQKIQERYLSIRMFFFACNWRNIIFFSVNVSGNTTFYKYYKRSINHLQYCRTRIWLVSCFELGYCWFILLFVYMIIQKRTYEWKN